MLSNTSAQCSGASAALEQPSAVTACVDVPGPCLSGGVRMEPRECQELQSCPVWACRACEDLQAPCWLQGLQKAAAPGQLGEASM